LQRVAARPAEGGTSFHIRVAVRHSRKHAMVVCWVQGQETLSDMVLLAAYRAKWRIWQTTRRWISKTACRCSGCRHLRAPAVDMRCPLQRLCPAAQPACVQRRQRPQPCLTRAAARRQGPGACVKCCRPLLAPAGAQLCSVLAQLLHFTTGALTACCHAHMAYKLCSPDRWSALRIYRGYHLPTCRVRALEPLVSPQRGMAESMDYMPAYRMPARWPSMIGTLAASPHEPLRVQVLFHTTTHYVLMWLPYFSFALCACNECANWH
jgi:hypothetical protein